MNAKRLAIIIIITALVAGAVIWGFLPKPVPVETAEVKRGVLEVAVEEEGRTSVRERYIVSAPVAGYLRRVELEAGDVVKKGQLVAELEPLRAQALDPRSRAEAQAAVDAAKSSLNAARENEKAEAARAEYARSNYERARELFKDGFVTKNDLERAKSEAELTEANRLSASARAKAARSELQRAEAALKYAGAPAQRTVQVFSPSEGKVLKVRKESEGNVAAGEPILDIGDPDELEVVAEVLSADAVHLSPGTPVKFLRWGGQEAIDGKVRVIEPAGFTKISSLGVEEQRVFVRSDIISVPDKAAGLGDGYRVEARFIIWRGEDVLQVPMSALFRHEAGWALYAVENKKARRKAVQIGHSNGLNAEVISGVEAGQAVIINPDETIEDGTRVRER